jgi:hypothetical protein
VVAARRYRDIAIDHGADAEGVDRAHGIENPSIQRDAVARVPVGEGISADDALAVEHNQVATAEFFEQRPDGRLVRPRSLHKRARGRGSSVLSVELEQRHANLVRSGVVAAPAIEHMAGTDHDLQSVLDRRRRDS